MLALGLVLLCVAVSWGQGCDVLQEVLEPLGEGTASRTASAFCLGGCGEGFGSRSVLCEVLEIGLESNFGE